MYDTARRVALVKQRVRENTRRRQRCEAISLSAACMLLFAVLMQAAGIVVGPGQPEAWGAFGAMLLREDAGGYVLVAVVSLPSVMVTSLPLTVALAVRSFAPHFSQVPFSLVVITILTASFSSTYPLSVAISVRE